MNDTKQIGTEIEIAEIALLIVEGITGFKRPEEDTDSMATMNRLAKYPPTSAMAMTCAKTAEKIGTYLKTTFETDLAMRASGLK